MHGHHHHHKDDARHHDHTSEWTAAAGDQRMLVWAILLNFILVIGEYYFGYLADSLALMADASHNLSDCMTLILALVAMILAKRRPDPRFTYGLGGGTILASLVNGLILLVIATMLSFSAFERLQVFLGNDAHEHSHISTNLMVWVSSIAAVLNIATALLFHKSRAKDLNLKGVYIHMMADAAVSIGVVVAALGIQYTGWEWIDPAFTLLIVIALFYATFSLTMEGLRLLMAAVPAHINAGRVRDYLHTLTGVTAVHDFHVWALSTREVAMTAHLIMPGGHPGDQFLAQTSETLRDKYGIVHATLQIETSPHEVHCALDGHTH